MKKYYLLTLIFSTFNVLFAQPDWLDDPGAYEFTATIATLFDINKTQYMPFLIREKIHNQKLIC